MGALFKAGLKAATRGAGG
ncbi:Protein of unknown function [Bacillus wiedmannii]|nr:Protein of unknown function [Bacillus wiedmannii]